MPRNFSSSNSQKNTSRQSSNSVASPQANQLAKPSMASGIMGSLMSGMAFGAGSEFIRQLFRNPTVGPFLFPLILSGGSAFLTSKLLASHPKKNVFAAAAFGGVFLLTYKGNH